MQAKDSKENENLIWTEKYRPREFNDIIGHAEIVKRARAFVQSRNMPNLLFSGPPGSGKTTLALIIAKTLFREAWHENFLELNASDERGIDVIRQKVKSFARTKAFSGPFKIIFLDESDALTKEAQQALRRTMEMFTNTCRFILSCNTSSKIIDPIQSRCSIFRFKLLEKKDVAKIVEKIAKEEKLKITQRALESLYDISKGDLRRVINILQASASVTKEIDENTIYEIIAEAKPSDVKHILELALEGSFLDAREKLLEVMLKQGLGGIDIIKAIQREIWDLNIREEEKIRLVEKCGETEFRLVEGSDDFIQLEALLASFILAKRQATV
ncbi:MAG: replication factor C small subunit [Candidatus Pacearchaeota archaeon]|nr:replication factor C small subunit [Candidatus Pacearchaeota archaeon]